MPVRATTDSAFDSQPCSIASLVTAVLTSMVRG